MKVTQETDYAIRICCALDEANGILDAEAIAKNAVITKSIALKVLRQLKEHGIVASQMGACGGYSLKINAEKLTVFDVIEAIEGRVCISKCLQDEHTCSKHGGDKAFCKMHIAFDAINDLIINKLRLITIRSITSPDISSIDIINILNK